MIPFLDHITTEMETRFGPIHQQKIKLLGLVPSTSVSYNSSSIKDVLQGALCCDEDAFPNILACTLPVTTCETERANSQLKLLKTYLRSTMSEERLAALAIIKVHRRMVSDLDFDELVVAFANKHPRRMALPCVLAE